MNYRPEICIDKPEVRLCNDCSLFRHEEQLGNSWDATAVKFIKRTSLVFHFDRSVACFHGKARNTEPDFFYVRYLPSVLHDCLAVVANILIPVFRLVLSLCYKHSQSSFYGHKLVRRGIYFHQHFIIVKTCE